MAEITIELDDDIIETIEYCCPDHPDINVKIFAKIAVHSLIERHAHREWQDDRATADDLVDLVTTDKTAAEIRDGFWTEGPYYVALGERTVRKVDLLRRLTSDQNSVDKFLDQYVDDKVNEYAEDMIADTVILDKEREIRKEEGMSIKEYVNQNLDQIAAQVDEEYDD